MSNSTAKQARSDATAVSADDKYLTFGLSGGAYGVAILRVREIIALLEITPLPKMPPSVSGVINLRGKIIPVVDLRRRLGLTESDFTRHSCIIVVEVESAAAGDGESVPFGCIVDAVNEVLALPQACIEPAPRFGGTQPEFLVGLGKVPERDQVVSLLDIDHVLGTLDLDGLSFATTEKDEAARAPAPAVPADSSP